MFFSAIVYGFKLKFVDFTLFLSQLQIDLCLTATNFISDERLIACDINYSFKAFHVACCFHA